MVQVAEMQIGHSSDADSLTLLYHGLVHGLQASAPPDVMRHRRVL